MKAINETIVMPCGKAVLLIDDDAFSLSFTKIFNHWLVILTKILFYYINININYNYNFSANTLITLHNHAHYTQRQGQRADPSKGVQASPGAGPKLVQEHGRTHEKSAMCHQCQSTGAYWETLSGLPRLHNDVILHTWIWWRSHDIARLQKHTQPGFFLPGAAVVGIIEAFFQILNR